jgi:hypothetical protein
MVGDVADHEVVLFGGSNSSSANAVYLNDTWTYQNGTWTAVSTPSAPAPRCSVAVSYDPVSQHVLLSGGWSNAQPWSFGDTWTFSSGTWTNITTASGPNPRNYAAMAFDPALGASILTGGHVMANAYSDTWAQNMSVGWQEIPTTATPPARWGLELSYDASSQQLYLFGGVDASATFFNDTWVFGPTAPVHAPGDWIQLSTPSAPSARAGAAMVYDEADGSTLLFGGCPSWGGVYWSHDCTALGDTWILSNGSWTNVTSSLSVAPPARADAGIAYDSVDRAVVLFGGFDGTTVYNDTWTYAGGTWTQEIGRASCRERV